MSKIDRDNTVYQWSTVCTALRPSVTTLWEKQRYGSQVTSNEKGEYFVQPLETKEKVDGVRKEPGMQPLADYLEVIQEMVGAKEIKFLKEY